MNIIVNVVLQTGKSFLKELRTLNIFTTTNKLKVNKYWTPFIFNRDNSRIEIGSKLLMKLKNNYRDLIFESVYKIDGTTKKGRKEIWIVEERLLNGDLVVRNGKDKIILGMLKWDRNRVVIPGNLHYTKQIYSVFRQKRSYLNRLEEILFTIVHYLSQMTSGLFPKI